MDRKQTGVIDFEELYQAIHLILQKVASKQREHSHFQ
jgi:hypothetical protein